MLNIRSILQYATLIIVLLLALDAFYSIGVTCYQIGDHAAENFYSIKNCSIFDGPFLAAMIWFANIFDHHGEAIVAAFTVILAISTIGLWVSTSQLWEASNRSAKIAERALTELEVPFIALKVIDPGIMTRISVNGQPMLFPGFTIEFCFANYGRTPAILTELKTDMKVIEIGKLPGAIDPNKSGKVYPFGVMVGPNDKSSPSTRFFSEFISRNEMKAVEDGVRDLFLIGFVKFTDIFLSKYTLGFCAKFDRKGGRYVLEGQEGYNYQTKEPA
jgi:hypothetical protein